MKKILLVVLSFFVLKGFAQHTFSIVAIDSVTGEIGSAGATCLSFEDGALAISDIILKTGAIHTQAAWEPSNQKKARQRMEAGESPQEIVDGLIANDNSPGSRQYGVVDIKDGSTRSAAYTGNNNSAAKGHRLGKNYAIQGNILISEAVLDDMEKAFLETDKNLCEKLMASMQAAKRPGADKRCLSDNISSGSAFIRVAKPTDTNSDYGKLWLDINVWLDAGDFTGDPIDELQKRFDAFKLTLGTKEGLVQEVEMFPNPSQGTVKIKTSNIALSKLEIYNALGQNLKSLDVNSNNIDLDLSNEIGGLYFIKFFSNGKMVATEKLVLDK